MTVGRTSILSLASAFGLGYVPFAPGTFGTLAAIPIWWALSDVSLATFVWVVAGACVGAVLVAHAAESYYRAHDVQHIVIDEVVGLLVTAVGVPFRWHEVVTAFFLFRVLDMTKPPPIRYVDRRVKGGLGVVLDDVLAGALACAIMHLGRVVFGGWW